jgi:PPK2 family polyphosphate:nucleotide phosphotransferase
MGKKKGRKKHAKKSQKARARLLEEQASTPVGEGGATGESVRGLLRLPGGPVTLADLDPRATPGFLGDKAAGKAALATMDGSLSDWQERLFAEGRATGSTRRVLVVLQGMDTAGKGGVLRHAVALVDPQGVAIRSFTAPTPEERRHDFLWRIRRAVPGPGMLGVFDRSHYEDVLVARVRELTTASAITRRYDAINRFEQELADNGVTLLKCMLHISPEEQRQRLAARLANPQKHWKFDPGDIDDRSRWHDYEKAYEVALERCHTDAAPWYVVPSDRKWYRNWAVATMLRETLVELDPQWPVADFDVDEQRRRLAEEDPFR